jgi:hypothetical protein
MKQQDLQQLAKYSDKYVAFVGNILHVIASGTSLTEVHNKLKEKRLPMQRLRMCRRLINP